MKLTRAQVDRMSDHAKAAYPDECCGVILGPPEGGGLRLIPCRNIQNEMHARDPEAYPREARRAYLIDPFEFERVLGEARERGEVLRGIFHSHPDEDAYFSQEDREAAAPFGDVPSFPLAEHVVMSVRDREVRDFKVFRWGKEEKDFLPGDFEVEEEAP